MARIVEVAFHLFPGEGTCRYNSATGVGQIGPVPADVATVKVVKKPLSPPLIPEKVCTASSKALAETFDRIDWG
jgi:hypothetical protein